MKKKVFAVLVLMTLFTSCHQAGDTQLRLSGDESNLPDELKGLKLYRVSTNNGSSVMVGVLNNQINSTTTGGKTHLSTIILNKQNNKIIEVKGILSENDSVIVCKK